MPAHRSRTAAPGIQGAKTVKSDCRRRDEIGRTSGPAVGRSALRQRPDPMRMGKKIRRRKMRVLSAHRAERGMGSPHAASTLASMIRLGVNLDHVATLRQARRGRHPDLLAAAHAIVIGGADHWVVHLREDRRHVQDKDVRLLRENGGAPLALELAATPAMTAFAKSIVPDAVCLVPEKREELTTEGGLDVAGAGPELRRAVDDLKAAGIATSLFVDPDEAQLVAANDLGADAVEIHTGRYAGATTEIARLHEFRAISTAAATARSLGMRVHAGHGLDYGNVSRVAALSDVEELNIGFAIVARAMFTGLERAVREMRERVVRAKSEEAPLP